MYGAWATGGTLAGNGESNNPYVIADDADWETFAGWINNANTHSNYSSKYYKLASGNARGVFLVGRNLAVREKDCNFAAKM